MRPWVQHNIRRADMESAPTKYVQRHGTGEPVPYKHNEILCQ